MTPNATTSNKNGLGRRPFKGVIFDLDDTLYPERQYILRGFQAVSEYVRTLHNINLYDTLVACYQEGRRDDVISAALARHFSVVDDLFVRRVAFVFRLHQPRLSLFDDARIALATCQAFGVRTGILTGGHSSVQRRKIAALEVEPLVDSVIYSGELKDHGNGRHAEDPFWVMSLEFGLDLADILYVADNPAADFLVPRKLGMGTVRIRRAGAEHSHAEAPTSDHEPEATITSLDRLAGFFMAGTPFAGAAA